MSLSFPRSAQFSWGGSPEPRRAPSPGCLCSQQDPVGPTRASAAGQGSRPSVPSMGRISLDERSQPEPMTATVAKRKA